MPITPSGSFNIKNTTFNVFTDNGNQIVDIRVSTTRDEYKTKLLPKLHDLRIDARNTPYARMFRAPLTQFEAKTQHRLDELKVKLSTVEENSKKRQTIESEQYTLEGMLALKRKLDEISELYERFNGFINHLAQTNPMDSLDDLLKALKTLETEINKIGLSKDDDYSIRECNLLKTNLINGIEKFRGEISSLKDKVPTTVEVKQLMSIQDQNESIKSLGTFIAEQLIQVSKTGIKIAYHISDNRFKDLIHVPPLVAALSDSKKMIELKALSLDGAEYNDTYCAMPLSPIEALDDLIKQKKLTNSNPEVTFSLKPYLSNWNLSDIDELVCLITDTPLVYRQTPSFGFGALKLATSLFEVFIMVFIRMPITLMLVSVDLISRILGFNSENKWTDYIDKTISDVHEKWSLVKWSKQLWNTRYKIKAPDFENTFVDDQDSHHQELLDMIKNESSYFQLIAKEYTSSRIATFIVDSAKTIWKNIKRIPQDIFYLFSVLGYNEKSDVVYRSVIDQYNDEKRRQESQSEPDDKIILCPEPNYAPINHIASPFEVPREVVVAMTDGMIDPMFRKSPATSTLFFALSATTFGTYILPAVVLSGMQSAALGLQIPTNLLSKAFTGRYLVDGLQQACVASFLEWQALVLVSELGIEIHEEHYDILASMFHEPEKISMALVGLVAIGIGLKFIPTLPPELLIPGTSIKFPIVYTQLMNLFSEEARSSTHGVLPFSLLTKLALGLKAALLTQSMLTGSAHDADEHTSHHPSVSGRLTGAARNNLDAHGALLEAITALSDKNISLQFTCDPLKGAYKFYDHLNGLFDEYNHELQLRGRADLCIDKQDLLDVFYNKYCKQEVSNVLCILSIFPCYPITLAWRGFKWLWASVLNKPSIAHQVEVLFNKDKVLAMQLLAMITKTAYSLNLAISYVLRPIAAVTLLALTVIPYFIQRFTTEKENVVTRKEWFQKIDEWSCKIALHQIDMTRFMRPFYARAARSAGSNMNVVEASERVLPRLIVAQNILDFIQVTRKDLGYISTTSKIGKILERHDRCEVKTKSREIAQALGPMWGTSAAKAREYLNVKPTFFFEHSANDESCTPQPKDLTTVQSGLLI